MVLSRKKLAGTGNIGTLPDACSRETSPKEINRLYLCHVVARCAMTKPQEEVDGGGEEKLVRNEGKLPGPARSRWLNDLMVMVVESGAVLAGVL